MAVRKAAHAGSWYSDSVEELDKQLENWLNAADLSHGPARAIIAPHAGYQYCGACSAFAYRQISPVVVKRVFILGPSHNFRVTGCTLSSASKYATPFYDLKIDTQVYRELEMTRRFSRLPINVDEEEHSLEMHLPFIAKVMSDFKDNFTIVPILVGSLNPERESIYGRLLSNYLADPQNLFVISSDFCHWGKRFQYTRYNSECGEIHESISKLDKTAMDIIETLEPAAFTEYLRELGNTICGRHPIGVFLQAAQHLSKYGSYKMSLRFLKYAQSSQCRSMKDSSVSYAAASMIFE